MKYSNKPVPEGINTSPSHPLRTFLTLLLLFLLLLAGGVWLLGKSGAILAGRVPFEREAALAGNLEFPGTVDSAMQRYLQTLADELLQGMDPDGEISVRVHYIPDPVMNAFATLGGHMIFHRGLLESLQSENAVAMLVAHELAHVIDRHPIASVGQGIAIQAGLSLLLDRADLKIAGLAGQLTQMKFSRDMELDADRAALGAVNARYGHINGALDLYDTLLAAGGGGGRLLPAFMATHPLTDKRIGILRGLAESHDWQITGPLTPLPNGFARWLGED